MKLSVRKQRLRARSPASGITPQASRRMPWEFLDHPTGLCAHLDTVLILEGLTVPRPAAKQNQQNSVKTRTDKLPRCKCD
jgi:hypothetical protein